MKENEPHLSRNLPGEVGVRYEPEVTLVLGDVVDDLHLPVVVHPQSPYDDVVHGGGDLAPRVVVSGGGKEEVGDTERDHLQVLPSELAGHGELLPAHPAATLAVLGQHRGVVAYLGRGERDRLVGLNTSY